MSGVCGKPLETVMVMQELTHAVGASFSKEAKAPWSYLKKQCRGE
jgi:hypothetical protein